ncbi:uncharacterized protein HaLaN_08393, partial [Haematococcus lacustris]
MAQRWPAPKVQPKLKQEDFDDAVKTNIEDFDMSVEEAVQSAVDEFKLQGYDMSCVVATSAGGDLANDALEKHAVAQPNPALAAAPVQKVTSLGHISFSPGGVGRGDARGDKEMKWSSL